MGIEIANGEWSDGVTTLSILDESELQSVRDSDATYGYRFESVYDDPDRKQPPAVDFCPEELKEVFDSVRGKLGTDPFRGGDFDPLAHAYRSEGEGYIIGSTESGDDLRKEFKMKCEEGEDTPYLKIQKFENGGNLFDSPTLGSGEFEGLFGDVTVL